MGRHKTISDEDVLGIAREAFRRRGFAVTGREIAKLAGVSEAVLYQRFESKDAFFFAAMAPTEPDLLQIFGPRGREGDAHAWIRRAVVRMSVYFEELIPLAIQVLMHPDYKKTTTGETGPASLRLEKELSSRLRSLKQRGAITGASHQVVARLLIGIAHDWALHHTLLSCCPTRDRRPLAACVDVAWRGIAPARAGDARGSS
jgi:AcrR family transcriptional regulator